jgi:hypothetical protein
LAGDLGDEGELAAGKASVSAMAVGRPSSASRHEAEQTVVVRDEELGDRLAGAGVGVDQLAAAVSHLLEQVGGQRGLDPGEGVCGVTGLERADARSLRRAVDVGRVEPLREIAGELILAAVRHRDEDGVEGAVLARRVGDDWPGLGDPDEILTAERQRSVEEVAGPVDQDLAREVVRLPAAAQPLDELQGQAPGAVLVASSGLVDSVLLDDGPVVGGGGLLVVRRRRGRYRGGLVTLAGLGDGRLFVLGRASPRRRSHHRRRRPSHRPRPSSSASVGAVSVGAGVR